MSFRHKILCLCLLGGITGCSLDPDLWYGDGNIAQNANYPILANIPPMRPPSMTEEERLVLQKALEKDRRNDTIKDM